MSVVALVRRPGYRDLLIGQGVSSLGDWMGTVALMALVLELTNSPIAVGGILTLRLLPAAIGGPLAARAAVRWDRRRTMLAMDATRAVMIALVPLVRALWWVYLWGFLVEVASIVFLPARDASIPDLVSGDDELPLANGLILGTSYGSIPIGAALFAAVAALPFEIDHRPYALVFFIDALDVRRLVLLHRTAHPARRDHMRRSTTNPTPASSTRSGSRWYAPVMPAALSVALGLGALFSLGIVFVHDVLHASDAGFGVLIALFGVGAAVGLFVLQRMPHGDLLTRTRFGVAYIGAVIAVFSLASALWIAWFGAAAFGAGAAYALSAGMGAIQSRLDGRQRVLAFAAFHVVLRVGLGVSAIGAGVAGDLLADVRWPLVGTLEPSRVVLLCAGVLVVLSSFLVRLSSDESPPDDRDARRETPSHDGRDRHRQCGGDPGRARERSPDLGRADVDPPRRHDDRRR